MQVTLRRLGTRPCVVRDLCALLNKETLASRSSFWAWWFLLSPTISFLYLTVNHEWETSAALVSAASIRSSLDPPHREVRRGRADSRSARTLGCSCTKMTWDEASNSKSRWPSPWTFLCWSILTPALVRKRQNPSPQQWYFLLENNCWTRTEGMYRLKAMSTDIRSVFSFFSDLFDPLSWLTKEMSTLT